MKTSYVIAICLSIIIGSWIIGLGDTCHAVMDQYNTSGFTHGLCDAIFFPLFIES